MNKAIAMISALTMAAVMCAGFAACNSDSDAESIVSDHVTQEEWEAAFAEENFTNCKLIVTEIYEVQEDKSSRKATVTHTHIQDGEKYYCKTKVVHEGDIDDDPYLQDSEEEYYWADGKKYTVTGNGVSVEEVARAAGEDERAVSIYDNFISDRFKYEDFEFSKEAKGYVYKQDSPNKPSGDSKSIIIKFKNGKLAAVIYSDKASNETQIVKDEWVYVFTYGGQTVTLPQV